MKAPRVDVVDLSRFKGTLVFYSLHSEGVGVQVVKHAEVLSCQKSSQILSEALRGGAEHRNLQL